MSAHRLYSVTTALTVGAVVVWGVKAVAIGTAGGLDESPLESPLFVLGLALYVLGVIAIGLSVTAGRSMPWRVLGAVLAFAISAVAFLVVDAIVAGLAPDEDRHWVWSEVQLWIVSVVTALGWLARRSRQGQAERGTGRLSTSCRPGRHGRPWRRRSRRCTPTTASSPTGIESRMS